MKKPRLAIGLLIICCVIGWWFFNLSSRKREYSQTTNARRNNEQSNTRVGVLPNVNSDKLNSSAQILDTNAEIQQRYELRKKWAEFQNIPTDFWGKVVDQFNQPLIGVKIRLRVRQWYAKSAEESSANFLRFELISSTDGTFELLNSSGDSLTVESVEKEGYELSSKAERGFGYNTANKFIPDPQNPEVFKMWKKVGAERLVLQNRNIRIPYDGTPVQFNLMKGVKVSSGEPSDIQVTLRRTPLEVLRGGREKYDWVAQVAAVDGGIIPTTDEFMYLAPETGYVPSLTIEMSKDDPNWKTLKQTSFYMKSRGNYGRVTLEFRTDSDQKTTGFTLDSAINSSGSRNLEYDSRQHSESGDFFPPK